MVILNINTASEDADDVERSLASIEAQLELEATTEYEEVPVSIPYVVVEVDF